MMHKRKRFLYFLTAVLNSDYKEEILHKYDSLKSLQVSLWELFCLHHDDRIDDHDFLNWVEEFVGESHELRNLVLVPDRFEVGTHVECKGKHLVIAEDNGDPYVLIATSLDPEGDPDYNDWWVHRVLITKHGD